jgi:hypothetical protein
MSKKEFLQHDNKTKTIVANDTKKMDPEISRGPRVRDLPPDFLPDFAHKNLMVLACGH